VRSCAGTGARWRRAAYVPRHACSARRRARRRPDAPGVAPRRTARATRKTRRRKVVWKPYPVGCVAKARLAPYLRSVTDDALTIEELRRRRAEILDLAGARSSSNCRFRFRCQGEARPGSDLDLLVGCEPGASLLDHVALVQYLEELLGLEVDVVMRNILKPRDEHICAEAIDLCVGESRTSWQIWLKQSTRRLAPVQPDGPGR